MKSFSDHKQVNIAYSSDSDDAFMMLALENQKIAWDDYHFTFYRGDIQELNDKAQQGEFDVTAISAAAYGLVAHHYQLLEVGASVADDAGPVLVTKQGSKIASLEQLRGKSIAVPGLNTTAYMALRRILPDFGAVPLPFTDIATAVLEGEVDAGVIIHELQLTYAEHGLTKIIDLGTAWQQQYNMTLPLGVNVIAKRLPWADRQKITQLLRASVEYGLEHRQETLKAATKKAVTDIGVELGDVYIEHYVNEQTLELDDYTRRGVNFLVQGENKQELQSISAKMWSGGILTREEAIYLFEEANVTEVMQLADRMNRERNGDRVYYNVNRHINPTNVCVLSCKFCSFSRKPGEEGAFALTHEEIQKRARAAHQQGATEVHLVGGLHPRWSYDDMVGLVAAVKEAVPALHIKAYTAVEIEWMARRGRKSIEQVLRDLQAAGLGSLPGGGAEIFHPEVRNRICDTKVHAETWLDIHRTAHKLGLRSNATMLYGHIESPAHRVDHMLRLRDLQEETGGFNVFIPLAFQPHGNEMGIDKYTSGVDDLKTIAIARLLLHNFRNIKAYWVMLGAEIAQLALHAGANDVDGTVEDEKISHMAGGRAGRALPEERLIQMIAAADKTAVERDSLYHELRVTAQPSKSVTVTEDERLNVMATADLFTIMQHIEDENYLDYYTDEDPEVEPSITLAAEGLATPDQRVHFIEKMQTIDTEQQPQQVQIEITPATTAMTLLRTCAYCRFVFGRKVTIIPILSPACQDSTAIDKLCVMLFRCGVSLDIFTRDTPADKT